MLNSRFNHTIKYRFPEEHKFKGYLIDDKYKNDRTESHICLCLRSMKYAPETYCCGPLGLYYACLTCDMQFIEFTHNQEIGMSENHTIGPLVHSEMWVDDVTYPAPFLMSLLNKDIPVKDRMNVCFKTMKLISKYWVSNKVDTNFIFNQKISYIKAKKVDTP